MISANPLFADMVLPLSLKPLTHGILSNHLHVLFLFQGDDEIKGFSELSLEHSFGNGKTIKRSFSMDFTSIGINGYVLVPYNYYDN